MNMDSIVGRMNEERARAEQQRETLAGELRAVEERIERIDVAIAEIEKASRPRRGRRPGTRAAAPTAAPTNGRRRGAGGGITAKDAMYRTLERIGKDGGVRAKVLRETAEKTFNREITAKSASNALNTLKHDGKIRREGYFWYLAAAPTTSEPAPATDETPPAASEPEPPAAEAPPATDET